MNWLTRLIPSIGSNRDSESSKSKVPGGLWNNCPACDAILYQPELEKSLFVCPKCDHHLRIGARTRMSIFFDGGSFQELATKITTKDILKFKDTKSYSQRIKEAVSGTGEEEAIVIGKGKLDGAEIVVAAFEFRYMGGSMGGAVGTKFVQGVDAAIASKTPLICFSTSGGARMQESMISLMQMAKTSAALEKLKEAKLPYISIMIDPIYGGVSASIAMLGDINIAEPKALVGFAGRRVIEQTVRVDLPEDFQKSEFLLEHGAIDMIVHRKDLRAKVSSILSKLYPSPMNTNRIFGIFIAVTILIWVLIFALSPQPKYQQTKNISIPELPEPLVDQDKLKKIEFKEVENDFLKIDTTDTLPSAKERVDKIDFNLYVYKIGAFGSSTTISNVVKAFNDAGFPAFTEQNKSNKNLTNVLVGPFASKKDIEENKKILNQIAGIEVGEVMAWNP